MKSGRATDNQAQCIAHRAEIGTEIDEVGNQQQADNSPQQRRRIVLAQIGGDALAGDPADAGANLLDSGR